MSLEIQQSDLGSQKLMKLVGRLDTETSHDFELAAYDAQTAGASNFVVDLSGVTYVSSAGLRVLLALAKKIEGKGSMKLTGLKGVVKEVFDKSGFARLFAIFPTLEAATGVAASAAPQAPSSSGGFANDVSKILGGASSHSPRPMTPVAGPTSSRAPEPQGFFARLLAMIGLGKK